MQNCRICFLDPGGLGSGAGLTELAASQRPSIGEVGLPPASQNPQKGPHKTIHVVSDMVRGIEYMRYK